MTMTAMPDAVTCELRLPNNEHFYDYVQQNARRAMRMLQPYSRYGKTLAICGAGPSLAETAGDMEPTDEVWACNSALPYLWDRKVRVTHAFTIDQHEAMLADHEFGRALPVIYLLATSTHPSLSQHLMRHNRRIEWFHSYLGVDDPPHWDRTQHDNTPYEMWLYRHRFQTGILAGHGLNSVPRALCVANGMGFDRILLYGADCAAAQTDEWMPPNNRPEAYMAWLGRLQFYADGRMASVYGRTPIAEAELDGRLWHTRADMVISARHLVEIAAGIRQRGGTVEFVGDVLPKVIEAHADDAAWMGRLPTLEERGAVSGFGLARRAVA